MLRFVLTMLLLAPLAANAGCVRGAPIPVMPDGRGEWYAVKANGAITTRPAYTLVDGRLIKSKERAPVGATCDTMRPTKPSGKDVYATFDSTDLVALCSKR